MTLKGKKLGKTVVLEEEPPVADGTELDVDIPETVDVEKKLKAQWESLMRVGYNPELADNIERATKEWRFQEL